MYLGYGGEPSPLSSGEMKKPLPSGPRLLLVGIAIAAALAIIPLTTLLRHPVLIPWRPWPLAAACMLAAVLGITALLCSRRRWILPAALSGALAIAGLGSIAWKEWTFARLKHNVLSTPEE